MDSAPLLDWLQATKRRDAALAQVEANSEGWVDRATDSMPRAIRDLLEPFIPEDVKLKLIPIVGEPHHFNCWGAVIRKGKKRGYLVRVDGTGHSKLPATNATEVPLYVRGPCA
jgi:hypothetical protein